jgi:outer membrane protein OmpA-like peptidoglycan-associated protein
MKNLKKQLFAFTAASMVSVLTFSLASAQERSRIVDTPITEGNSAMAISYPEGPTLGVKFKGTHRLPQANGEAKVERKRGRTDIEIRLDEMKPAAFFGGDYATYVLWIVSPEGQVDNIGEFVLRGNNGKLNVTTPLQTFAMFVTAEPHYLVSVPSRFVVAENTRPKHNITGEMLSVSTIKYRGFEGVYNHSQETLMRDPEVKGETRSDVRQALVSVRLAERAGAKEFAAAELAKARESLDKTMEASEANVDPKQLMVLGHETVRLAVDAQKQAEERSYQAALNSERTARAREIENLKTSIGQAQSDAERARLEAEQKALALEMERRARESALAKANEEALRRREAELKADELAKAKLASDFKAGAATQDAEKARQERDAARARMQAALSAIVETRETVRGIIVNLPDILFDVDKATLKPQAREILSKVCGIMQVVGEYDLSIEGHTDSTGSDEHNQRLSENRARSVHDFLAGCGLKSNSLASKGFGELQPIASNETNDGRQKNRRVEIVIQDQQGMVKKD